MGRLRCMLGLCIASFSGELQRLDGRYYIRGFIFHASYTPSLELC